MTVLVTGATAVVPPSQVIAAAEVWLSLHPTLQGDADGSPAWDLSDPSGGVVLMRGGARGFAQPPIDRQTRVSATLPGSRWQGFRVMEREVFLPLHIFSGGSSASFVALERAFWSMLRPDKTCTLTVTLPDGSKRSLRCRVQADGSQTFDMLPVRMGWANYGLNLSAEDPFWHGPTISRTWQNEIAPLPTYPAAGADYVLYLSSGSTLATATVSNPGDVESYPQFLLKGPFNSAAVGVGSDVVRIPFAVSKGSSVLLDANPERLTATLDATDVTELGDARWPRIPAGDSVRMNLTLDGTGSITVFVPTNYLRAW